MENIIVLTALYILVIALIYAPKCPTVTATDSAPIDYFPEVETVEVVEETDNLEPEVIRVTDNQRITEIPVTETMKETDTVTETAIAATATPDLATLTIRQLKVLAKGKIKNYGNLTKAQLIQRLSPA